MLVDGEASVYVLVVHPREAVDGVLLELADCHPIEVEDCLHSNSSISWALEFVQMHVERRILLGSRWRFCCEV